MCGLRRCSESQSFWKKQFGFSSLCTARRTFWHACIFTERGSFWTFWPLQRLAASWVETELKWLKGLSAVRVVAVGGGRFFVPHCEL